MKRLVFILLWLTMGVVAQDDPPLPPIGPKIYRSVEHVKGATLLLKQAKASFIGTPPILMVVTWCSQWPQHEIWASNDLITWTLYDMSNPPWTNTINLSKQCEFYRIRGYDGTNYSGWGTNQPCP